MDMLNLCSEELKGWKNWHKRRLIKHADLLERTAALWRRFGRLDRAEKCDNRALRIRVRAAEGLWLWQYGGDIAYLVLDPLLGFVLWLLRNL